MHPSLAAALDFQLDCGSPSSNYRPSATPPLACLPHFTIYLPSPDLGVVCSGFHNRAQDGESNCSWLHSSPKPHTTPSVAKRKPKATHHPGGCYRQRCWREWGEWGNGHFLQLFSLAHHVPNVPSQIAGTSSPFHMTLHSWDTDPTSPSLDHLKRNAEPLCRSEPSKCTPSGLSLSTSSTASFKTPNGQGCMYSPPKEVLRGKVWESWTFF